MLGLPLPADLKQRRLQPELMDQPELDPAAHVQALRGLERINFWSGSVRILWPPIRKLFIDVRGRPVRLLDIATGAGDVPVGLWRKARRLGIYLDVDAWDVSPRAVEYAKSRAAAAGVPIRFCQADALATAIPPDYDAVICSLFLHHLERDRARHLLQRMGQGTCGLVLVNDLVRSYRGFLLAWMATRLLSASRVVHVDGPRSVEGAFSLSEVRTLAAEAGLLGARVARRWPCRFLLTWERPR